MVTSYVKRSVSSAANSYVYRQLDVWRAFAATWVIMVHACATVITDPRVFPETTTVLTKNYLYAFSMYGQLGVTMFFVISGYCISLAADNNISRQKSIKEFLQNRFRRIYPPYYASILLTIALALGVEIIVDLGLVPPPNHKSSFLNNSFIYYFSNLTLTQVLFDTQPIQIIYWSLSYEIAFYLIVAVCIFLTTSLKYSLYTMIFIVTQISLWWLIISPDTCPFPLNLWYLFGLGSFVYMLIRDRGDSRIKLLSATTLLLTLLFAYFHEGNPSLGHPSSRAQALFGSAFSVLLLLMYNLDDILMKNRFIKLLSFLGVMSYSLYLSHAIIITFPRQLMIKMGFIADRYWTNFLAQIAVAIGFGYVFHIFCERPFMRSSVNRKASVQHRVLHPFTIKKD